MNLLQIRTKFRELSGRYDLVNDDFSDNGADFFINEASKWLDKTIETSKSWASYMAIVTANSWYLSFPTARAVKEVWISTTTGRWQLRKQRLQDLIAAYYSTPPALIESGTPLYYSPTVTRYIPEDITPATLATFAAFIGIIPSMATDYNAIIFSSPVDVSALIEVKGLFYSFTLTNDDDENYWSKVNPLLLIQTAMRQTHLISGNKAMLDIVNGGISDDLMKLDKDLVEQEIAGIDQMEG
jgi:hypothetical protein